MPLDNDERRERHHGSHTLIEVSAATRHESDRIAIRRVVRDRRASSTSSSTVPFLVNSVLHHLFGVAGDAIDVGSR